MPKVYKTPGVYREDIFLQPQTRFPTGVPGFVGFAEAKENGTQKVVTLYRKQEFAQKLQISRQSYLHEVVNGFFENGGIQCYVAYASIKHSENAENTLVAALDALAPLSDLDLVAIPDAMTLQDEDAIIRVQQAVLQHCSKLGDRLAILDGFRSVEVVKRQQQRLTTNQLTSQNGTLYFPWLKNTQDDSRLNSSNQVQSSFVPPCGHVAGVFARSDQARGVFKAPANEEIFDVLDLEVPIDNVLQGELNPLSINCLRAFPSRGIRIWGARTLSQDINWRYINVRRLFLTIGRWIEQNMYWATFEPNSELLWVRIQRELSTYLEELWRFGALQGQTQDVAFYVKCDAETNPPESRETGEIVTEIGLAPNTTAEFIIVRIIHRAGVISIAPAS